MKYILFSFTALILLTACSRKPVSPAKQTYSERYKPAKQNSSSVQPLSEKSPSTIDNLYQQYSNWRGTPYRYGGLSRGGVDCSGFVLQTYKSLFNIRLPRSTKDQVSRGKRVYINQLSAGDLVFFKTGRNIRHVGIYLEKGKFVHASSSKGVTVSSIYSGYWKKNYWQARRLL